MMGFTPRRRDGRSQEAEEYHRWYNLARWRKLRARQLWKEPLCRECAKIGRVTEANTADHIIPHRGDPVLFWDPENLQSLCGPHHTAKQKGESGGTERTAIGADGWPITGEAK